MTQLRILATAPRGHEFAVADAINELVGLDGLAIVPRQVSIAYDKDGKQVSYDYRPFLPNYIFLSLTEAHWYHMKANRLFHMKPTKDGDPVRVILPELRRVLDILPRTWQHFTDFAQRAELACDLRIEQHKRGVAVRRYKQGDVLRIVGGDLMAGQLHDKLAKVLRLDGDRITVEVQGLELMGKPVTATLDGWNVEGIAAE